MEPPKLSVRAGDESAIAARADNDAEAPPPAQTEARGGSVRKAAGPARKPKPGVVQAVVPPQGAALPANVAALPSAERREALRIIEALLFAAAEPIDEAFLARHLRAGTDVAALIEELKGLYAGRGVNLVRVAGKWAFRTAEDLGYLLERHAVEERRLSKAALETLAIIAYHQPVTRAEIEEIRGVETSKGTIDILLETGWVRPRGRRRAPGKPLTYGTTPAFLDHFSLDSIKDLPGLADLKGAGLLDATLPADFKVPEPTDVAALMPDELPLEDAGDAEQGELDLGEGADGPEGDGGDEKEQAP
jgi:segregation and condensation protein B